MKNDTIRELLEDELLTDLIAAIADHPDHDHVTIVTLRRIEKTQRPNKHGKDDEIAA